MNFKSFIHALLVRRSEKTIVQLFRYVIVSGVSLVVDFVVLYLLTELAGFHYLVSAAISYVAGLIVNYFLSIAWVFYARKLDNRTAEFSIFAGIGIAGMGINELTLWVLSSLLGLHYLIGRGISAVIGYTWKYVARKWMLFK
jgi:putative flippase GtrA